jgi:hypothetical protein
MHSEEQSSRPAIGKQVHTANTVSNNKDGGGGGGRSSNKSRSCSPTIKRSEIVDIGSMDVGIKSCIPQELCL